MINLQKIAASSDVICPVHFMNIEQTYFLTDTHVNTQRFENIKSKLFIIPNILIQHCPINIVILRKFYWINDANIADKIGKYFNPRPQLLEAAKSFIFI